MNVDLSSAEEFQKSWLINRRPLFLVDECRTSKPGGGEYILFAFLQTDTATALKWAAEAHQIKQEMTAKALPKVLKGRDLFGSRRQNFHEPYRDYVRSKLSSLEQISFLLVDSTLLPAIIASAPSGITLVDGDLKATSKVTGRELSPFLNCIKAIVSDRKMPHPIIDILVDRSFQLGLDPASRSIKHDQFQIIGPGPIASSLENEFIFVSVAEEGAFSDLLVLPDSLAYLLLYSDESYIGVRKQKVQELKELYYWHDVYSSISHLVQK